MSMFAKPEWLFDDNTYVDPVRISYERLNSKVQLIQQEKSKTSDKWRNKTIKLVEIEPDPPNTARKYIWCRKRKYGTCMVHIDHRCKTCVSSSGIFSFTSSLHLFVHANVYI